MNRVSAIALAASGPACVGLLRFLIPYYTAPNSSAAAQAVAAHPERESVVLWLSLAAILTLAPGLYAVRHALPASRLSAVAFSLTLVGYLTLPVLLVEDMVLWTGAQQLLAPTTTGKLVDGLHPAFNVGVSVFIAAHVLGTVLLGVACLRGHALPTSVGWALLISQPLHFVTTVFLGRPWVDLVAWSLTALAMGWLAATSKVPRERQVPQLATGAGRSLGPVRSSGSIAHELPIARKVLL